MDAEALHAATFVIHADQQFRAQRADGGRQLAQLRRRLEIAPEQDHATHACIAEARPGTRREAAAFDTEHDRAAHTARPRAWRAVLRSANRFAHRIPFAACRISAYISRTDSRRPTNTLRDTIACPICSSRTPGSAATGWTLK